MKNNQKIKLTQYSSGAGWACKINAKDLTQVLSKLKSINNTSKFSGYEKFDDCAIYPIDKEKSIIQTVDFFTPIVDDPYLFGKIAANNSLSDIYAMGGTPLFALNIVAFPTDKLPLEVLSSILQGGQDKCNEDNVNILGGHSIKDDSPKYGLAVTGIIENKKIIKNSTAKINDAIILTKQIGTGIISTAIKKGNSNLEIENIAIKTMLHSNKNASKIMQNYKVNACTDITGYGLLGHLNEICSSSNLTAHLDFKKINFIDGVEDLAKQDIIPGGTKNNYNFYKANVNFKNSIKTHQRFMLSDAQTAGGLLITCTKNQSDKLVKSLNQNTNFESKIIGYMDNPKDYNIFVN